MFYVYVCVCVFPVCRISISLSFLKKRKENKPDVPCFSSPLPHSQSKVDVIANGEVDNPFAYESEPHQYTVDSTVDVDTSEHGVTAVDVKKLILGVDGDNSVSTQSVVKVFDKGFHRPTLSIESLKVLANNEQVLDGNGAISFPLGRSDNLPMPKLLNSNLAQNSLMRATINCRDTEVIGWKQKVVYAFQNCVFERLKTQYLLLLLSFLHALIFSLSFRYLSRLT